MKKWDPTKIHPRFDRWYLREYQSTSPLVLVKYEGIKRGEFRNLSRFHVGVRIPNPDGKDEKPSHEKQDTLFIARQKDWQIVQPCCKWRPEVKEKKLGAEAGLGASFETKRYFVPFALQFRGKKITREPVPVRLVLRNGLVITCKILRFDKWDAVVMCEHSDKNALILVFKHAVLSVERAEKEAGKCGNKPDEMV